MNPLELVKLTSLMERTRGDPRVQVGLIDGPVAVDHPDLAGGNIREVPGKMRGQCARAASMACMHGTFVAGILCGKRDSAAPAICPGCTLLLRPIFMENTQGKSRMPSATPGELAAAIRETIDAGARVINLSAALAQPSTRGELELDEALDHAARQGVLIVAAAGNQGTVGSTAITRHPWVIPVAACDLHGRPTRESNLGSSIGRRGLSAPGEGITSLAATGKPLTFGGTSAAAPFVTGTIALLWSNFPSARAAELKRALTQTSGSGRHSVVPPLLNAWHSYQVLDQRSK